MGANQSSTSSTASGAFHPSTKKSDGPLVTINTSFSSLDRCSSSATSPTPSSAAAGSINSKTN
ncbi:hypothetical protein HDU76_009756, partial [Blyttiomyces sp. JEL0837]